jgi:hypothetical protein
MKKIEERKLWKKMKKGKKRRKGKKEGGYKRRERTKGNEGRNIWEEEIKEVGKEVKK